MNKHSTETSEPEDIEVKQKKLLFRSKHRGFKEVDIILGGFAEKYINSMKADELAQYEQILEQPDNDIYDWYTGKLEVPQNFKGKVVDMLMAHKVVE